MSERSIDQKIIERVLAGDKAAFDLLVKKYQHRVAKLVSRYVRDTSEVEDVVQEAFVKAYRALHNFRFESAFYTWLYRIAINAAKNYLELRTRQPERMLSLKRVNAKGEEDLSDEWETRVETAEISTPEHNALTDEIAQTVKGVIERLPVDLRTAITLREIEGLSYEEIAEVMDCPIGTVRSRIFRAREAIDEKLKPLLEN